MDQISLIPHCNGTHVEHVGHIVNSVDYDPLSAVPTLMLAAVVSVNVSTAKDVSEAYRPTLDPDDLVITAASLKAARSALNPSSPVAVPALVIRTLPNSENKCTAHYDDNTPPPFLTVDAMEWIVERGCEHLLVDFPSLDRMHDEGRLTNHHLFWDVAEGTHELPAGSRVARSITEMVFVPNDILDGVYLLNLQFPDWASDAAPARPILFHVQADDA